MIGEENLENENINENINYEDSIKISDIFDEIDDVDQRVKKLNKLLSGKKVDILSKK